MIKLKTGGQWLRDFGLGTTDNEAEAHAFTHDEAHVLQNLWPDYYSPVAAQSGLYSTRPPAIPAGDGRIWVRYKNTWLAVEKQAAFLGTRKALTAEKATEDA
jgi:hypothetical protein